MNKQALSAMVEINHELMVHIAEAFHATLVQNVDVWKKELGRAAESIKIALWGANASDGEIEFVEYIHDVLLSSVYIKLQADAAIISYVYVGYCPRGTDSHSWHVNGTLIGPDEHHYQFGTSIDVKKSKVPNLDIELFTRQLRDSIDVLVDGDISVVKYTNSAQVAEVAKKWEE